MPIRALRPMHPCLTSAKTRMMLWVMLSVAGMEPQAAPDRLTVHFLASGSSGNSTLVRDGMESFLVDFGLAPGKLAALLRAEGMVIRTTRECRARTSAPPQHRATDEPHDPASHVGAVVLTHLHSDHCNENGLKMLLENGIRLWLHRAHVMELEDNRAFRTMRERGLVSVFDQEPFAVTASTRATPLPLPHDSAATHGFLFERRCADGSTVRIGYLADLGFFPPHLAPVVADCDLLALEFNHDEMMEVNSRRHPRTIERTLGDHGHLSNEQATYALHLILSCSEANRLRWLALMHISRDCNLPDLALREARKELNRLGARNAQVLVTRHRECAGVVDLLDGRSATAAAPVVQPSPALPQPQNVVRIPIVSRAGKRSHILVEDFFGYE
jgi:phosphoribosyl 1,2-cyclic phosphodiesterase